LARRKQYKKEDLTVYWDPKVCIHSGVCLRSLPAVFNLKKRPWIQVDSGDNESIQKTINACPSGALGYLTASGERDEHVPVNDSLKAEIWRNGPLTLSGEMEVKLANGETLDQHKRLTICRCGASSNKPYCDGTHHKIKFKG